VTRKRRIHRFSSAFAFLAFLPVTAVAAPLTQVVVFGDSLLDDGSGYHPIAQLAHQQGRLPAAYPVSPPYFDGRFSNGPVSSEYLASALGLPLDARAQGGATTGIGNIADGGTPSAPGFLADLGTAGLLAQLAGYAEPVDPDALYVVWAGPNNFMGLLSAVPAQEDVEAAIAGAVGDVLAVSLYLAQGGAQHLLVPGMPDLGLTPLTRQVGPHAQAAGTALSDVFNVALRNSLAQLVPAATFFDTAALMRALIADPALYGLLNVTEPCKPGPTADGVPPGQALCATPDQYLFWDGMHPTTAVHRLVAGEFARVTAQPAAVPEPASLTLLGLGLVVASAIVKRGPRRRREGGTPVDGRAAPDTAEPPVRVDR
jgi:phospholipase/lecithinase/hemolysin